MIRTMALERAIDMWRRLVERADEASFNEDFVADLEIQILDADVSGHNHAAAICEVLALNIACGERPDGRDTEATKRLGLWHAEMAKGCGAGHAQRIA